MISITPSMSKYLRVTLASNPDQGAVYSLAKISNPDGFDRDVPFRRTFDRDALLVENYIPNLCLVHREGCFHRSGYFDENLPVLEDWDLLIRLSAVTRFGYVPTVTGEYVFSNERNRKLPSRLETTKKLYEKYFFLTKNPIEVANQQCARLAHLSHIVQVSIAGNNNQQNLASRSCRIQRSLVYCMRGSLVIR